MKAKIEEAIKILNEWEGFPVLVAMAKAKEKLNEVLAELQPTDVSEFVKRYDDTDKIDGLCIKMGGKCQLEYTVEAQAQTIEKQAEEIEHLKKALK